MKHLLWFVTWVPVIFTIGITTRCGLLYYGYDIECLRMLFSAPPLGGLMFSYLSWSMKFCWVHQSMVWYVIIVNVLTMVDDYGVLDPLLPMIRLVLYMIGLLLILILYTKLYVRKEKISRYCPRTFRSRERE